SDLETARGKKGVGHATADHQLVDLQDQISEKLELGRDLGASDHRHYRALRIGKRILQRTKLGLHQPPGCRGQPMSNTLGRGMGTVRSREGVIDIDIAKTRKG